MARRRQGGGSPDVSKSPPKRILVTLSWAGDVHSVKVNLLEPEVHEKNMDFVPRPSSWISNSRRSPMAHPNPIWAQARQEHIGLRSGQQGTHHVKIHPPDCAARLLESTGKIKPETGRTEGGSGAHWPPDERGPKGPNLGLLSPYLRRSRSVTCFCFKCRSRRALCFNGRSEHE